MENVSNPNRKQLVLVAPQFPPCNLTASHRCRYLATGLAACGWEVTVLTVEPHFYEEPPDEGLLQLVSPSVKVRRTKALRVGKLRLIGDIGLRSFWWQYCALADMAKRRQVDLVYIPIPPNYSAVLGRLLWNRFRVPYALDYIDPWVHPAPGSERSLSRAWWAYQSGRMLEPYCLRRVSFISAVAPGYYEEVLKRYPRRTATPCLALPYGAEKAEFAYLQSHPRQLSLFDPADGKAHLVYAGHIFPKVLETLRSFCAALAQLKKIDPACAARIQVHFIGTALPGQAHPGDDLRRLAQEFALGDIVREHPRRIPYLDVLAHLKASSGVLILGSAEPYYTPSKIFQSVLSLRPVLAVLHAQSSAVSIMERAQAGRCVTFDDARPVQSCVGDIAEALLRMVREPYDASGVRWEVFEEYSALSLARGLSKELERVLVTPNS